MHKLRCTNCDTIIQKEYSAVNIVGGYPCPTCSKRGAWMLYSSSTTVETHNA
jgi:hypothetical protein